MWSPLISVSLSRQSCNSCPPSYASRLSGLPQHHGGVHSCSDVAKSPSVSGFLIPGSLGQLYFFHTLPFSLNVASFIFTQVVAWPLQCLHAQGISLLAYLDDIAVWHHDRDTLLAQMQQVICFLQDIGFRLNLAKSHPYPSTSMVWLGIHWLPQSGHWHLPVADQNNIRCMALELLQAPKITHRQLERIVGLINFSCQVHRYLPSSLPAASHARHDEFIITQKLQ